ncbi:hypothetical protein QR680_016683 [Steinernema hermaphroditum]|uniref:Uncharacterized protein n=1 Tax=Steinernema hermaphroditum TaxID=289476 RepID=A0AA39HCY6_9BILA|nr:hypothetical protein QR680_016683 [Steinernema hermaphroditum]
MSSPLQKRCEKRLVLTAALNADDDEAVANAILPYFKTSEAFGNCSLTKFLESEEAVISPLTREVAAFVEIVQHFMNTRRMPLKTGNELMEIYATSISMLLEKTRNSEEVEGGDAIERFQLRSELKKKKLEIETLEKENDELFAEYNRTSIELEEMKQTKVSALSVAVLNGLSKDVERWKKVATECEQMLKEKEKEIETLKEKYESADAGHKQEPEDMRSQSTTSTAATVSSPASRKRIYPQEMSSSPAQNPPFKRSPALEHASPITSQHLTGLQLHNMLKKMVSGSDVKS